MKVIDKLACPIDYSCEECINYSSDLSVCLVLNKIIKSNYKYKVEKRFRKNFLGICFISYLDSNIRREVMEVFNQLYFSIAKH